MTNYQSPNTATAEVLDDQEEVVVEESKEELPIYNFETGMIGFPQSRLFALLPIEAEKYKRFHRLQNIEEIDLSFFVIKIEAQDNFYSEADWAQIKDETTEVYTICTLLKEGDDVTFTTNLRAPVIIDLESKEAVQYLFPNNDYSLAHKLS